MVAEWNFLNPPSLPHEKMVFLNPLIISYIVTFLLTLTGALHKYGGKLVISKSIIVIEQFLR